MSLTLNASRSALLSALSDAASTRDRNPANPIYNAVLLTFEKNNISVRAISQSGSVRILCVGNGSGSACFNPDELIAWLKVCSDDVVRLEDADNERIEAKCGKSSRKIACVPPSTFPVPRDEDTKPAFTINGGTLVGMLAKAAVATDPSDSARGLDLVFAEYGDGTVMFTGASTIRLIRSCSAVETSSSGSFTMAPVAVATIRKIHKDSDSSVTVSVGSTGYSVDSGDVSMHFRMSNHTYVDYRQFIPKQNKYHAKMGREHMVGVMLRMAAGADSGKPVMTRLSFGENEMEAIHYTDNGRAVETAPFGVDGGSAEITVNAVSMAEVLRVMDYDDVVFGFYMESSDPSKAWNTPCILAPSEKPEGYDDIYLVMPVTPITERK